MDKKIDAVKCYKHIGLGLKKIKSKEARDILCKKRDVRYDIYHKIKEKLLDYHHYRYMEPKDINKYAKYLDDHGESLAIMLIVTEIKLRAMAISKRRPLWKTC
jgi:hypothetical protein